jgi:hypothetical protein
LISAVNATTEFFALPYGPRGVAPDDDPREFELYFEKLEAAGIAGIKRPDLLIFRVVDRGQVEEFVRGIGGAQELPFLSEGGFGELLGRAIVAVECENSLWVASKMPAFGFSISSTAAKRR